MGRTLISIASSVVTAGWLVGGVAVAGELPIGCPGNDTPDAASRLAKSVREISGSGLRYQDQTGGVSVENRLGYGAPEFMPGESETTWHIQQNRSVPTQDWSDEDKAAMERLLSGLPACLRAKAGIGQAFRVEEGRKSSEIGFKGIVYSWQNREYKGGRTVMSDLFFDHTSYNGELSGDEQMQIALGWEGCQPPSDVAPNRGESPEVYNARRFEDRLSRLPPELQAMTRERILFHEYIHGVTHQQKSNDRLNPLTYEGFTQESGSPSRFQALRDRYLAPGSDFDLLQQEVAAAAAMPPSAESRAAYCSAVAKRNEFLANAEPAIPQRWPGDIHALESEDEYVTILIETVQYDPSGAGYSPEEIRWAKDWWQETFGAPMGSCAPGDHVADAGQKDRPDATLGYGRITADPGDAAAESEYDWAAKALGWFWF